MERLIDADETIKELKRQRDQYEVHDWVNLKESLINDGYDFAITDVEHMPTVEAISKADYEARLKADMVAMLKELEYELYHALCYEIHGKEDCPCTNQTSSCLAQFRVCDAKEAICRVIDRKIADLPSVYLKSDNQAIIDWNNCYTSEQLDSIATTKNDLEIVIEAMEYRANSLIENIKSEIMHFANAHCSGDDINIYDVFKVIDDCCEAENSTTKNDLGVDLVSRVDAIQAMQDKAKKLTNEDTINGLCGAVAILFELPSVTPQEPTSFQWCTDCKEYDQEKHCCHRWSKVIRDTVEEMKQEQEPKTGHWIKTEEWVTPTNNVSDDYQVDVYTCSCCKSEFGITSRFCSKCGAKMVEPQESEG